LAIVSHNNQQSSVGRRVGALVGIFYL
jgi:hypothetical protein